MVRTAEALCLLILKVARQTASQSCSIVIFPVIWYSLSTGVWVLPAEMLNNCTFLSARGASFYSVILLCGDQTPPEVFCTNRRKERKSKLTVLLLCETFQTDCVVLYLQQITLVSRCGQQCGVGVKLTLRIISGWIQMLTLGTSRPRPCRLKLWSDEFTATLQGCMSCWETDHDWCIQRTTPVVYVTHV